MHTGMSDAELVKLAQRGNGEAFGILFERYNVRVLGYLAGRLGNTEEVYDLAQKTFFKAWQGIPQLHDVSKFKPWLYSIARNEANSWWRSKAGSSLESWEQLEEQLIFVSRPGPEDQVAESEIVGLALAELSPKYRDCLLLQIRGGLTLSEIAEVLGISRGSATTYSCNARKLFREVYQRLERDLDVTAKRELRS